MMRLALARCFADPRVQAVLIDPLVGNVRARRFYERLGFAYVEERRFGDDDCAVYTLTRARWESAVAGERRMSCNEQADLERANGSRMRGVASGS